MSNLNQLTAAEAARRIRDGQISSEELVKDCLARIDDVDGVVQAWAHIDAGYAIEQAKVSDKHRRSGAPLGALHGVPVGIKDVFDTFDYPTEYGSLMHLGRRVGADATAVARLREAGAIILGKTITAEYAVLSPGKTTNPHDPTRTPGGSSSGSAAAVAAGMVPLAIGTQTNGSIIRPASYCGVVGYKPTFGLVSRHRVLRASKNLDHVGVFAHTLEDTALMAETMIGFDSLDGDTSIKPRPNLREMCAAQPPMPPHFAFVKGPAWNECDKTTQEAFAELVSALGGHVEEVNLDGVYDEVFAWNSMVMYADIAKNYAKFYDKADGQMSESLMEIIENGRKVHAVDYTMALDRMEMFAIGFDSMMNEFDAIITPSATTEAPQGLGSTGNPACATLWSFTGMPAISLPLLEGPAGMPLGVQIVSRKHDDARLFRNGAWLVKYMEELSS